MNKLIISVISLVMILSLSATVSAAEETPGFLTVDDILALSGDNYADAEVGEQNEKEATAFAAQSAIDASITYERVIIKTSGQIVDTFMGVPAYYAPMTSGSPYQCSELITRYTKALQSKYGSSFKGWAKTSTPKAGDYIYATADQRGKGYGHWAIIKSVSGNRLTLIEQNWTWYDGSNYIAAKNRVIPWGGDYEGSYTIYTPSGVSVSDSVSYTFSDVSSSHWASNEINTLVGSGILNGVGNGKFEPEGNVTRAQFATMLAKASGMNYPNYDIKRFSDVPSSHWAYTAINWAYVKGVVSGVGSGKFDPEANITRQEIAVMLYNYATKIQGTSLGSSSKVFTDNASIASWAKTAVSAMANAGVISGYSDGSFGPNNNAVRAEAAVLLYRLID